MMAETQTAPRGRPRDPERDRAIVEATLDLLAEEGYARLTIEAVAHRAGVGKPTLYRRWPSKAALVIDSLHATRGDDLPVHDGPVRERLIAYVSQVIRKTRTQRGRQLMAGLIGELARDPELAAAMREAFVSKRRRVLFRIFDDAIETGELPSDLDRHLAADLLFGPIMLRALVTGEPLPERLAATLVDALLGAANAMSKERSVGEAR
jgi:AcrR family transcriptional regulator